MKVTLPQLYDAIDVTWPALATRRLGPFTLRDGDGGGQRVSATTLNGDEPPDFDAVEAEMPTPLFMVRDGDTALDQTLDQRGYRIKDVTNLYVIDPARLTDLAIPHVTAFAIWEPLQIMRDIWAEGGINAARLRVMDRVTTPKTAIFGRINDQPAGAAFVAVHDGIAMLHALEIRASQRRQGLGQWMMRRAAYWAVAQNAHSLAILVTQANAPANALYSSLGMAHVGHYHYRIKDAAP